MLREISLELGEHPVEAVGSVTGFGHFVSVVVGLVGFAGSEAVQLVGQH